VSCLVSLLVLGESAWACFRRGSGRMSLVCGVTAASLLGQTADHDHSLVPFNIVVFLFDSLLERTWRGVRTRPAPPMMTTMSSSYGIGAKPDEHMAPTGAVLRCAVSRMVAVENPLDPPNHR